MTLVIRVAGVDVTADVMISEAEFEMGNGPNPGAFSIRVKDPDKTYTFRAG